MGWWERSRELLVGTSASSISHVQRQKRWASLQATFPTIDQMDVLDLGGTVQSWVLSPVRPAHVTLVNRSGQAAEAPPWISQVVGDACDLPLSAKSSSWDLVYSNSVIEHVGGFARRAAFAREVRDMAPAHWVQTPNRYFPIEPHFLFPCLQFMPVPIKAAVAMHWPLSGSLSRCHRTAVSRVLDIELVGQTEMAHHFPDATIVHERFLGLTKSVIAVRHCR